MELFVLYGKDSHRLMELCTIQAESLAEAATLLLGTIRGETYTGHTARFSPHLLSSTACADFSPTGRSIDAIIEIARKNGDGHIAREFSMQNRRFTEFHLGNLPKLVKYNSKKVGQSNANPPPPRKFRKKRKQ